MKLKNKENSMTQKDYRVALWIFFVIFVLFAFTLLYPMFWILVKSFMNPVEFKFEPNRFFPSSLYFDNYANMFKRFEFLPMIINTVILSVACPTIQLAACCCISYAFAKFKFRFKGLVYFIALSSMFIPSVGTLAATYELMIKLRLMDKLIGVIIMCGNGMGFSFLLVSSQYVSVSKEYSEAAEIDGASKFRIFVQIITPQILPTVLALWVLSFISTWNDYATPYLFLPSHRTLSVGIKELNFVATQSGGTDYPILFAGIIMVEIPVLILFFLLQKRILKISLGGGIKG